MADNWLSDFATQGNFWLLIIYFPPRKKIKIKNPKSLVQIKGTSSCASQFSKLSKRGLHMQKRENVKDHIKQTSPCFSWSIMCNKVHNLLFSWKHTSFLKLGGNVFFFFGVKEGTLYHSFHSRNANFRPNQTTGSLLLIREVEKIPLLFSVKRSTFQFRGTIVYYSTCLD